MPNMTSLVTSMKLFILNTSRAASWKWQSDPWWRVTKRPLTGGEMSRVKKAKFARDHARRRPDTEIMQICVSVESGIHLVRGLYSLIVWVVFTHCMSCIHLSHPSHRLFGLTIKISHTMLRKPAGNLDICRTSSQHCQFSFALQFYTFFKSIAVVV